MASGEKNIVRSYTNKFGQYITEELSAQECFDREIVRHSSDKEWLKGVEEVKRKLIIGKSVYVQAGGGAGKTTLLAAVANEFQTTGYGVNFLIGGTGHPFFGAAIEFSTADDVRDYIESATKLVPGDREKKLVILDRLYEPLYDVQNLAVREALETCVGDLLNSGNQILMAGRIDIGQVYPEIAPRFEIVNLKSKQIRR